MKIATEEFVRIWQTSATIQQVSDATGIGTAICSAKAGFLRRKGVPLKKFNGVWHCCKREDYKALADLAASLAPTEKGPQP